jgi:hypothetical protein
MDRADIVTINLPNGQVISLGDWSDVPRYSTGDFLGGWTDVSVELFQYAAGDQVASTDNVTSPREATIVDSNMERQSGVASSEEMLIYAIKLEPYQLLVDSEDPGDADLWTDNAEVGGAMPGASALTTLMRRLIVTLKITQKPYAQAGFGYFCQGFGPHVGAFLNGGYAGVARAFANNGSPGAYAVRPFAVPSHVAGTETFGLAFENPTGESVDLHDDAGTETVYGMRIRAYADGLYRRPVG